MRLEQATIFFDSKASAKDNCLRKSLQGECRTGLLADLYDRTVAADAVGVNSELGPRPHLSRTNSVLKKDPNL